MKFSMKKETWLFWSRILLFVLAIVLLAQMFPGKNKFKYSYQNQKPWKYDLLTAPFDFEIEKDPAQIKKEQDSILRDVAPYFNMDTEAGRKALQALRRNFAGALAGDSTKMPYLAFVERQLTHIYSRGILSTKDAESLAVRGVSEVNLVRNFVAGKVPASSLFTVKSAYGQMIAACPESLDVQVLRSFNLNKYLAENLSYDEKMTEQIRAEALRNKLSRTMGIVQAGERIVDKGEIVNDHTFVMLNSLKNATEAQSLTGEKYYLLLLGQVLFISTLMFALFAYLYLFRRKTFNDFRRVVFLLLSLLLILLLLVLELRYTSLSIYLLPFAFLPIVVRTFFDSRTTFFIYVVMVLLASVFAPNPYEFILLQLAVGIVALFNMKDMVQRSQLILTLIFVVLTYSVIYFAYELILGVDIKDIHYMTFVYFLINGLLLLFSYGLIFVCEKTFGFLSNMTLIELSNVSNRLLTKFSEDAPGTFQHSLQVANLATEAAARINANSLLVRTGALYHDIGKMTNPMYFIENQAGKMNPLSALKYEDAAQIVISHVSEGVRIAQKNKLPNEIIDFIRTHHAQSKTRYFYNSYKNEHPDENVDEKLFTYSGPKPFTKELSILMMADAVEAASRSLPEYTEQTIDALVENIIDGQIAEGSFKNAPITFLHIETIKSVFKQKLKNIYHSRINYPKLLAEQNKKKEE